MNMREGVAELFGRKSERSERASDWIRSKSRAPLAHAALGLASMMLTASPALAQDGTPPDQQDAAAAQQDAAAAQEGATSMNLDTVDVTAEGGSPYNPQTLQLQRIATPILDTPATITVIPQQVMQDQQTSTVVEALHNSPGITFFGGEGGTQGDNINIRGYSARNDFYRDGVRDPGWYTRDVFSIQNIEVLKGPASFLFGRGSTGGVVNMTSKLPVFTDFTTVEMSGYTAPGTRVTADVNRMFGDTAFRVVLLGNDTDVADRNHIVTKRVGAAPSFTVNMTNDTRLTVSYIFQKDDNIPDYGIPVLPGSYFGTPWGQPTPVPANTYYGRLTPSLPDTEQVDAHIVTLRLDHDFNEDWKISNVSRFSYIDRFVRIRGVQVGNQTVGTAPNLWSAAAGGVLLNPVPYRYPLGSLYVANTNDFQNHTQNYLMTNQTDLTGHFNTGFLNHTVTAGIELSEENRSQLRTTLVPGDRVDVGDPNPYPVNPGTLPLTSTLQDDLARTIGLYANDQVRFNPCMEFLAGLRFDRFTDWQLAQSQFTLTSGISGPYNSVTPYNLINDVTFVSWRAGPVVHPLPNMSVYFMYGTSFDPSSEYLTLSAGQQNLPPTTDQTMEVGSKINFFDNRLSLDGALFRTTQSNAIEALNSALGLYAEVGETRVQGFELGISGNITDQWAVFGGYTFMQGRVLDSALSQTTGSFVSAPGNGLQNVPCNTFTMTTTYAITPQLTVGSSTYFVDKRWTSSADIGLVPGYWRFDAMARYRIDEHMSFQLNLINLGGTKNFETISGYGSATPGPGRSAILTAKITF